MIVPAGQLSGTLRTDWTIPWPHSEPCTPTLDPDQLALLVLPAPLPIRVASQSARQLRICSHPCSISGSLLRRLVLGRFSVKLDLSPSLSWTSLNLFVQMFRSRSDVSNVSPAFLENMLNFFGACPQQHPGTFLAPGPHSTAVIHLSCLYRDL